MTSLAWSVIVLTGGTSSRMGFDKATADLGGRSLLAHVIDSIPADASVIVVGPEVQTLHQRVVITREEPPGGGPVAGIAAGLALVTTPYVCVLAVDMPWAGPLLKRFVALLADSRADAILPRDEQARPQPLAGAYRAAALHRALGSADPNGRSVRSVISELAVVTVAVDRPADLIDIDTPRDLDAARRSVPPSEANRREREESTMDEWVAAVKATLGLDANVDVDQILDLAREAAHGVARPAAPLTAYLFGLAVAAGHDPEEAAARLTLLARDWPKPE